VTIIVAGFSLITGSTHGQDAGRRTADGTRVVSPVILGELEWQEVEAAVDKGLTYLSQQQRKNGAFQQVALNDPGISALCVLAFMSRGHLPGQGPYGEKLEKSVDFLLGCQQVDGMLSQVRHMYHSQYNHAICALALTEFYGMSRPTDEAKYRRIIEKALEFTGHRYSQPKKFADDQGSWRYLQRRANSDGDLSMTSWSVMFLRSAKNTGFEVDNSLIEEALAYMKRLYDPQRKTFRYENHPEEPIEKNYPRGMAGAGLLSLSLAGEHHSEIAKNAANYILKQPFDQFGRPNRSEEYPCYGAFYCSHGMFQMGGEYWKEFYPQLVKSVLKAQRADGSWMMQQGMDVQYGQSYTTALTILALTPPYQMLPIFQR
jgi:hypothetical protein